MRWRGFVVALAALSTAACAATVPVAVVTKAVPGGIMRGTNTVSLSEGSFTVSNGTLSCGGSYDPLDMSHTITMTVLCNDGRKGIVIATRNAYGTGGGGTFTLNDGTTGDIIFGAAAGAL
jgi:hypothetical protein